MTTAIKITSLGTSGAGKTCFMLGMYSAMQLGVRGFTFSTPDLDLDLRLTSEWRNLVDTQGDDRWPPPNDKAQTLMFDFNFGFKRIMGFEWYDYRGAALNETTKDEQLGGLLRHLEQSEAVILCLDGNQFAVPLDDSGRTVVGARTGVLRMNQLLQKVRTAGKNPSVIVTITKFDVCSARPAEEIVREIKELLNPLFIQGGKWLVALCPITLGRALSNDRLRGAIDPKNVHLPVTFAIHSVLSNILDEKSKRRESADASARSLRDGFLASWWNRAKIEKFQREAEELRRQIGDIGSNLHLLGTELVQSAYIYYDGVEQ